MLGLAAGTRDAAVNKVSGVLDIRPVKANNVQSKKSISSKSGSNSLDRSRECHD